MNEDTVWSQQVPLHPPAEPEPLKLPEEWLTSYQPRELFDEHGRLKPELAWKRNSTK